MRFCRTRRLGAGACLLAEQLERGFIVGNPLLPQSLRVREALDELDRSRTLDEVLCDGAIGLTEKSKGRLELDVLIRLRQRIRERDAL